VEEGRGRWAILPAVQSKIKRKEVHQSHKLTFHILKLHSILAH
jgi:hypothetical protein